MNTPAAREAVAGRIERFIMMIVLGRRAKAAGLPQRRITALRQARLKYLESVPADQPERAHPCDWGACLLWGTGVKVK